MKIAGQRVRRKRLIQTDRYVVAVEVELVVPPDDPSEPCYEAETVNFLREVRDRAERGELTWLQQHGKVYAAVEATCKYVSRQDRRLWSDSLAEVKVRFDKY